MQTVRYVAQSVLPESVTQATMAPAADTSFAAHVADQFTSYEKDRAANSKQTLYATRYHLSLARLQAILLTLA
jgi:hypothetical protein